LVLYSGSIPGYALPSWAQINQEFAVMDVITAKVAQVPFGNLTIEGLLLEDGKFAVALQQAATLFQIIPTSAPKWLRTNLGKDSSLYQVKTNRPGRIRKPETAISLLDFERLLRALDKANNPIAVNMSDALIGLSLTQLFSDAFEIEVTKEQRLTPYVHELCVLLDVCNTKQEFATKYAKRYGAVQTELFAA
jgi:hypothetical protein